MKSPAIRSQSIGHVVAAVDVVVAAAAVDGVTTLLAQQDILAGIGIQQRQRTAVDGVIVPADKSAAADSVRKCR